MSESVDPYGRGPGNARYKPLPRPPSAPPTTTIPMPQHPSAFKYVREIEEARKKHPVDECGRSLDRTILEKVKERRKGRL